MKYYVAVVLFLFSFCINADLEQDRVAFKDWTNTYKFASKETQQKKLAELENYILYPYAKYQYLLNNLNSISEKEISSFIESHPYFPSNYKLLTSYLSFLINQKNWKMALQLNPQSNISLKCQYALSMHNSGNKKKALTYAEDLMSGSVLLPRDCQSVIEFIAKESKKNISLLENQIVLNVKSGNTTFARTLITLLPSKQKKQNEQMLTLLKDAKTLPLFVNKASLTTFNKKIALLVFKRFIAFDVDKAKNFIPQFVKTFKLTQQEQTDFYNLIASNYFRSNATEEQIKWRDGYLETSHNSDLIERRVRQALNEGNKSDLTKWLAKLPIEIQQKDEWQYWKARDLINQRKLPQARQILKKLSEGTDFYAMVSAQSLGLPYHINFDYPIITGKSDKESLQLIEQKYANNRNILRIEELLFHNMDLDAKREWLTLLSHKKKKQTKAELAKLAFNKGWGAHSIQATISGKLWDNWRERMPVLYEEEYQSALQDKEITQSFGMAIARQESALDPNAGSSVGARGLMQIMPTTASDVAKKMTDMNYKSSAQLYDPVINIQLGTFFLNSLYIRFEDNRILASAAYNAGPTRVLNWLNQTNGQIDAVAFIESIPFNETRNYVKRVLVYDYIYKLILNEHPQGILTIKEIEKKY